ncbi:hypothetical protein R3P38DRAFT_3604130 [Favolaschia claudopus]|uniref:Uncharacterized protein n=1 Tax=Favolaschia claudopus TaxID=2862362 RepID=A0AAW0A9R0_9AGAR
MYYANCRHCIANRVRNDLHLGSEALPRRSNPRSGPVHFQAPSDTREGTNYVLSWPPVPHPITPTSGASDASFVSVYYTPPTSPISAYTPSASSAPSTPSLTDSSAPTSPRVSSADSMDLNADEDRQALLSEADLARHTPRLRGWARLHAKAPPRILTTAPY